LNTAFSELINNNTSLIFHKFPSCKCFEAIKNLASPWRNGRRKRRRNEENELGPGEMRRRKSRSRRRRR